MAEHNMIVEDGEFKDLPRGGSNETFDDHLQKLDGTDPAQNLDFIPDEAKGDGLPRTNELQPESVADEDGPKEPIIEGEDEPTLDPKDKADDDTDTAKGEEAEVAEDGEYTEADRLKELGVEANDFEDYIEQQKQADMRRADAIRASFARRNIPLLGRTTDEIALEIEQLAAVDVGSGEPPQATKKTQPGAGKTLTADDIFQSVGKLLEEFDVDDQNAKFQKKFTATVAEPLLDRINELDGQLAQVNNIGAVQDFLTDRMLYSLAAEAKKGDGPIPPFSEVRRIVDAERRANPAAWAQTMYRLTAFGTESDNPFLAKIDQWRTQKNAVGMTNAQVEGKRQTAKVAKFRRQTTAGKGVDRMNKPKKDAAADATAYRKTPVTAVWPNG